MQLLVDLETSPHMTVHTHDAVTFKKLVPIDLSFSLQDTFEAKFESIVWNYAGRCRPTPAYYAAGAPIELCENMRENAARKKHSYSSLACKDESANEADLVALLLRSSVEQFSTI